MPTHLTALAKSNQLQLLSALLLVLSGCTAAPTEAPTGTATGGTTSAGGAAGGPSTTAVCDATQLLPSRLVRLASTELRDQLRRALPGVEEQLLQAVDLQAEHVAKVSERAISAADFSAYYQAALSVALAYAGASPETEPCRLGGADACLSVAQQAVTRLYRRPPTSDEWARFSSRFQNLAASHDLPARAAAVIAGALLSPQVLYRTESGQAADASGITRLTRSETIDLASFAFTGKAADMAVAVALTAVSDAELASALGNQAAAWAQSPEFVQRASDFAEIRFGVQHLPELSRSDPAFTPEMRAAFSGEFREFVGQTLLAPGGTFTDLFTKSPSRVFPGLEAIYATGPLDRRKGVLGLAGLLSARAAPNGSDPVKRGMMVRVDLLCETVPPPIAGADFDKVMVTEEMQTRERFEALAALPTCTSCHQVINPPGYLFEEFDQLGRYRASEKGRPINASGSLPPALGQEPYPGVGDWQGIPPLADWLASSAAARSCFAAHFVSYILSEPIPNTTQNCMLPSATARFLQSGRLDDLATDLVASDLFHYRLRGTQ